MITPAYALTATERVLPRLALDFTTGVLDSRVTVTRALDTATRVNSSGYIEIVNANLPRFDYDPITFLPRGLLIEETRINSILQSETFSTTWSNFGYSLDKNYIAPDGQNNATKIVPDNSTTLSNNALQQNVSKAASSITYTCSIFAKAGEFNRLRILVRDVATGNNFARATFNLGTKTVSDGPTAGGTFSAASVSYQDASEGFIRYCLTFTTGTETSIRPVLVVFDSVATTGNGTSGVYAYGAQLEAGAFATSYIPTTTTSLTRNADAVSMTGTNFSDWFNASEGTFVVAASINQGGVDAYAWGLLDGAISQIALRRTTANTVTGYNRIGGNNDVVGAGSWTTGAAKIAYAIKSGNQAVSINGAVAAVNTSSTFTQSPTNMLIGTITTGFGWLNGHVSALRYYPIRLTNSELRAFSK